MRRGLLICLVVPLLGFVPPKLKLERRIRAVRVRVVDAGQTYSTINTIDCLAWPSEDIRMAAGTGAWSGWNPRDGDAGIAIGRSKHCFQDVMVIYVRIGTNIAPIGTSGLSLEEGSLDELPLLVH